MLSDAVEIPDDQRIRVVPVGPGQPLKTPLMEDQGQLGLNIVCEETTRPTKSKRKVKKYNTLKLPLRPIHG
jgi:hypothetical protein